MRFTFFKLIFLIDLLLLLILGISLQRQTLIFGFMDKKLFKKVVSLNRKKEAIEDLLGRFETQDATGCDVTVVFTNSDSSKFISDEFRECLRYLLTECNRAINEL